MLKNKDIGKHACIHTQPACVPIQCMVYMLMRNLITHRIDFNWNLGLSHREITMEVTSSYWRFRWDSVPSTPLKTFSDFDSASVHCQMDKRIDWGSCPKSLAPQFLDTKNWPKMRDWIFYLKHEGGAKWAQTCFALKLRNLGIASFKLCKFISNGPHQIDCPHNHCWVRALEPVRH